MSDVDENRFFIRGRHGLAHLVLFLVALALATIFHGAVRWIGVGLLVVWLLVTIAVLGAQRDTRRR